MVSPLHGDDDGRSNDVTAAVDVAQFRARHIRARLLDLLDALIVAMERRDPRTVTAVLDQEDAERWFPSGLREEALVIARLPSTALRAPMRVYRYYHQLRQLGEEAIELTHDPRQLTLDLLATTMPQVPTRFFESTTPAPDAPRSDDGTGRRRSGSR